MEPPYTRHKSILLTYSARATTDFSRVRRRGYAGATGRLDILVRTTRTVDEDTELVEELDLGYLMVLEGPPSPPLTVYLKPGFWKKCPTTTCSEGEAMETLRNSVIEQRETFAARTGLREVIETLLSRGYRLVILSEKGAPLPRFLQHAEDGQPTAYVLGGYDDPPDWLLEAPGTTAVSLGPVSYLASHAAYFLLKCVSLYRKRP